MNTGAITVIVTVGLICLVLYAVRYLIQASSHAKPDELPRYAAFDSNRREVGGTKSNNPSTTWSILLRKYRVKYPDATRKRLKELGYTVRMIHDPNA
jgi:hypothetical protein